VSLSDGAHLAVTETLVGDRTGRIYGTTIQPDVSTDLDAAEQAAKNWLMQQCGK
jgi:hypothetical protein